MVDKQIGALPGAEFLGLPGDRRVWQSDAHGIEIDPLTRAQAEAEAKQSKHLWELAAKTLA